MNMITAKVLFSARNPNTALAENATATKPSHAGQDGFIRTNAVVTDGNGDEETISVIRETLKRLSKDFNDLSIPPEVNYENLVRFYPQLKDLLSLHFTSFDNPQIIAERLRILKTHHQFYVKHGVIETSEINTPTRIALRHKIADKIYGQGASKKDRQAYILIGSTGSGKSTISEPLAKSEGALILDGDDIRREIPEYQKTHCADLVKKEMSIIIKGELMNKAAEHGDNIVIPFPPQNEEAVLKHLNFWRKYHYQVHLIFIDTSIENAVARTLERFNRTGRLGVALRSSAMHDRVPEIYEAMKRQGGFQSYQRYDNNVPLGTKPILREEIISPNNDPLPPQ